MVYAIIEVGGFLGMGENLIAVPYDSLTLNDTGEKISLPGATKEELQKVAEVRDTTSSPTRACSRSRPRRAASLQRRSTYGLMTRLFKTPSISCSVADLEPASSVIGTG